MPTTGPVIGVHEIRVHCAIESNMEQPRDQLDIKRLLVQRVLSGFEAQR